MGFPLLAVVPFAVWISYGCSQECDGILNIGLFTDAKFDSNAETVLRPNHGAASKADLLLMIERSVQNLLLKENLGRNIRLQVKQSATFASADADDPDANRLLEEFCLFQNSHRRRASWDLAILLTGEDLYVEGKTGKNVRGVAHVGSVCNDKPNSCLVVEGNEPHTAVVTILHEIGHSLGMVHDEDSPGCQGDDSIMTATLDSIDMNSSPKWSECSKVTLDRLLDDPRSCLAAAGKRGRDIFESLPIVPITANEQCQLAFGPGFVEWEDAKDRCQHLYCRNPNTNVVRSRKGAWPLEGTECGNEGAHQQRCWKSKCTTWTKVKTEYPCSHVPLGPTKTPKPAEENLILKIFKGAVGLAMDIWKLLTCPRAT